MLHPRKKYPLRIRSTAPTPFLGGWHFRLVQSRVCAQGYSCRDYRLSSSFGSVSIDPRRVRKRELADIEAATDVLVRRRYIDRRRVFAAGGSYGGYMVAWMNGRVPHGKYRAYICHAGCFDWVSMFADDTYPFHAKEFGAWYWKDFRKVEAQNPRALASRMTTPTLVIHGASISRAVRRDSVLQHPRQQAPRRLVHSDENHWI